MNPESAGVPGVMLRLKRRIASYMYMYHVANFVFRLHSTKKILSAMFFLKKCWPSTWHEASYG